MKVPIILTEPPPEFGELHASAEFADPNIMDHDHTYVPGFSELRLARDRAIIEVMQGRRRAADVPTLPYNFRWVRSQTLAGKPDTRKMIQAGNRGYKMVTKDEVGEGKLLATLPPGAEFNADGRVQQGDTVLMIADAQRVARNELQKRAKTESAIRGSEAGFAAALAEAGGKPMEGASPYIKKELGQPVRAELNPKSKSKSE
jgi:hypothetical protein